MRIILLFILLPTFSMAQDLTTYNTDRVKLDKRLMLTLGSWSAVNIGVSSVGWATTNNEAKYFHQMNVMWSGVNLALAIPGYFKARKTNPSNYNFAQTYHEQTKTEKFFLFNTGLDLAYITAGFYLKQRALTDLTNYHRFRGYGNSLIMQGGFLFLFDLTAVILHNRHRKQKLSPFLNRLSFNQNGPGFVYFL